MKKALIFSAIFSLVLIACDKVKNAYPPNLTTLDIQLYPNDWSTYTFPVFTQNTNTTRNVLIEDFTGHKCTFCPAAAEIAHTLEEDNPGRVYVSTIHSGPAGDKTGFQATSSPNFEFDFTTPIGLAIGGYFGSISGSNFFGNPSGNVSRVKYSGNYGVSPSSWSNATNALLTANVLKVNLQAVVNYYDQTKGAFVHVEVDVLDPALTNLGLIVGFYQDSIIKPQVDGPNTVLDYVHRDLLKTHINGDIFGETIKEEKKDANGKYYYDYSYRVPDEFPATNAHFLIYVVDKLTLEVYQVIKKEIL
ncbi:MAG: Omp28-related outer membrane protein [Bacteroidota bacterium]